MKDNRTAQVMLIHPYKKRFATQLKRVGMPIGLLQLAACVEDLTIPVVFLDAAVEGFENERMTGEVSPIDGEPILRYGLEIKDILDRIRIARPAVIGLSSLTTSQFDIDVELGLAIREAFPWIKVITGGYHASTDPAGTLSTGAFDYVITGEGEIAFSNLVKDIVSAGSYPRRRIIQGRPILDLNALPLPAYHLVSHLHYGGDRFHGGIAHNKHVAEIFTARGCPNNCDFCAVKVVHGRNYRKYSLKYVSNLLNTLKESGFHEIVVEDDNFMADKSRAKEVMELIRLYGFEWTEIGGVGIQQLTDKGQVDLDLIEEMAVSGCYRIYLAIESPNAKTMHSVHKENLYCRPDLAEKVMTALVRHGIEVYGGFMIGFPTETLDDVENTVRYAAHLRSCGMKYAVLFHTTPVPGTALGEQMKKNLVGCRLDFCFERSNYDSPNIPAATLNRERRRLLVLANGQELADAWAQGGTWPT